MGLMVLKIRLSPIKEWKGDVWHVACCLCCAAAGQAAASTPLHLLCSLAELPGGRLLVCATHDDDAVLTCPPPTHTVAHAHRKAAMYMSTGKQRCTRTGTRTAARNCDRRPACRPPYIHAHCELWHPPSSLQRSSARTVFLQQNHSSATWPRNTAEVLQLHPGLLQCAAQCVCIGIISAHGTDKVRGVAQPRCCSSSVRTLQESTRGDGAGQSRTSL